MTSSSTKGKKSPDWAKQALQGVTFWMGHRRCFYRRHPLTEGAMIAEICNLIHANLPHGLELTCEVLYAKLLPEKPTEKEKDQILTELARADLVVSAGPLDTDGVPKPKFIIEVKRGSTPNSEIDFGLAEASRGQASFSQGASVSVCYLGSRETGSFRERKGHVSEERLPDP